MLFPKTATYMSRVPHMYHDAHFDCKHGNCPKRAALDTPLYGSQGLRHRKPSGSRRKKNDLSTKQQDKLNA